MSRDPRPFLLPLVLGLVAAGLGAEEAVPATPVTAPAAEVAPATTMPAAESMPTAASLPTAESTPVAAPAADAAPAATTEPAPVTAPSADSAPAPEFRFDQRSRLRAEPAPNRKTFYGGASIAAGYDSNILLENPQTPTATDAKGFAWSAEGRLAARLAQGERGQLTVGASAGLDQYPGEHTADLLRYGGNASATWGLSEHTSASLAAGHQVYRLDDEPTAQVTTLNLGLIRASGRHVLVVGGDSQFIDYSSQPAATGTFYDGSARWWWLREASDLNHRVEIGLLAGRNHADGESEQYGSVVPSLGAFWRFNGGAKPAAGTIDLTARAVADLREYDEPVAGDDHATTTWQANVLLDRWWNDVLATGLFAGYSRRGSTVEAEQYDRIQAGLRLAATW